MMSDNAVMGVTVTANPNPPGLLAVKYPVAECCNQAQCLVFSFMG